MFSVVRALSTVRSLTATALSSDPNSIALLDVLPDVLSDANSFADEFMANDLWVGCAAPTIGQDVNVTTTNTAVGYFDLVLSVVMSCRLEESYFDISLFPHLWLEFFPLHVAFGTVLVVSHPASEFARHIRGGRPDG